jgi:hypothetical protein
VLHRPSLLPVPLFRAGAADGGEPADSLLYTGQKVLPRALLASGYSFQHDTLDAALRAVLGR